MKICMMSVMMSEHPVEEIVKVAKLCNMDAIDWIGLHGKTAAELKKLCDDAGLYIAAHTMIKWGFVNGNKNYMDEFKASLDDACTFNAPVLMLPPFARKEQQSMADDRKRYAEYYAAGCELAKAAGVQLTLESTGFLESPITTAEECLEILKQIPDLRVTFDQGNVATADDPESAFLKLRDYVVHFHLKDWLIYDKPVPGSDLKRCGKYFSDVMIGEGDMDIKGFWQLTNEREKALFVNPETKDHTGKRNALETFKQACSILRSY